MVLLVLISSTILLSSCGPGLADAANLPTQQRPSLVKVEPDLIINGTTFSVLNCSIPMQSRVQWRIQPVKKLPIRRNRSVNDSGVVAQLYVPHVRKYDNVTITCCSRQHPYHCSEGITFQYFDDNDTEDRTPVTENESPSAASIQFDKRTSLATVLITSAMINFVTS